MVFQKKSDAEEEFLRLAKGDGGSFERVNSSYFFLLYHCLKWAGGYFPIGLARGFLSDDAG